MEKQKYLGKFQASQYVFIRTDCNRQHFRVGIAENLQQIRDACYVDRQQWIHQSGVIPRLVFYEAVQPEYALQRYRQLQRFTPSQMARLICSINRNWKDLRVLLETADAYRKDGKTACNSFGHLPTGREI